MPDGHDVERRHRAFYDAEAPARADRALDPDRLRVRGDFVERLRAAGARSVLEVGCGAGRDASALAGAGLAYVGLDLSAGACSVVRAAGHRVVLGSATRLPFVDGSVDAAWSASTLMHLPGNGLRVALDEVARVVRADGLLALGVWGHDVDGEWTDPHGRYFRQRTVDGLLAEVRRVAEVIEVETWGRHPDGGHYQWVVARPLGRRVLR
ncbi:class I SAM-dependent methyltransferase [Phycicoccus sp. MAQZ13P-2]|uniref:class I SAM-dependent methyltransferase n=1 Tax=Phycicoccus mangrovi TaxID=2840470 RepID=UPI001C0082A3|nr:class I SAM-dependent methyltransferase [Phycicoccus mangrovi]MBT9256410.1 class I SAM-dependent methyltransferase [Phycicoccus mangrovi]MBT9275948.1 class I SAM-dependent methyltransferase [Phycicoccus mangrovi]